MLMKRIEGARNVEGDRCHRAGREEARIACERERKREKKTRSAIDLDQRTVNGDQEPAQSGCILSWARQG